jgi:hypothetical protein
MEKSKSEIMQDLVNKIRAKKSTPGSDFSKEEYGGIIDTIKVEQSNPVNLSNNFEENFKNHNHTMVEKTLDILKS